MWDGTEVLIVGGSGPFGRPRCSPCADGFAYNPSTNRWRRLPRMKFPRVAHVAVWSGTQLLVWGGVTDPRRETVPPHGVAYDPATNRWSALPISPLRGRTGATAVWTGTSMIVWGAGSPATARLHGRSRVHAGGPRMRTPLARPESLLRQQEPRQRVRVPAFEPIG